MIISDLELINFRNYKHFKLKPDNGIYFIYGNNGQGKTNLLEALYYLSCTKSHRINDDKLLIKRDEEYFRIKAKITKRNNKDEISVINTKNGKNLFLYKTPIKKVSNFIGILNAVMFCPDDMNLFNDSPKVRRRFIDLELGKLSSTNTLSEYHKILKERNAYLKNSSKIDQFLIETFNDRLIKLQIIIIKQRTKLLKDVFDKSFKFYQKLSNDKTRLSYKYLSFVEYDEDEKKMFKNMKDKYHKSLERDIYLKMTTAGIHKDDFIFYLNDEEVKDYASQGQKRTIILSLKIGIIYTIYEISKEFPIVLLDDVFSELDKNRRIKLLELLDDNIQIFITTNDYIKINTEKKINYLKISNGKLE